MRSHSKTHKQKGQNTFSGMSFFFCTNCRKEVGTIVDYIIVTNNPQVVESYQKDKEILFKEVDFKEILTVVRDLVYQGKELLTHPLSGSVKPLETHYKSVLVSKTDKGPADFRSVQLIENALSACSKFAYKNDDDEQTLEDMQAVDLALISGAIASADA